MSLELFQKYLFVLANTTNVLKDFVIRVNIVDVQRTIIDKEFSVFEGKKNLCLSMVSVLQISVNVQTPTYHATAIFLLDVALMERSALLIETRHVDFVSSRPGFISSRLVSNHMHIHSRRNETISSRPVSIENRESISSRTRRDQARSSRCVSRNFLSRLVSKFSRRDTRRLGSSR